MWYNFKTGQYENGEDPSQQASAADEANRAAREADLRQYDPNAKVTQNYNYNTNKWENQEQFDEKSLWPDELKGYSGKYGPLLFHKDQSVLPNLYDSKMLYKDPRNGGYWVPQQNVKPKKHWQDTVAKYMPTAIMALGTMGMGSAVGPLAKAGFGAGLNAMKGLSQGQKPLGVLKNAAIGAGIGYAGHLAGQALGGGFQGQLANRFVKQIPNLMNMYKGTPNLTAVSPGNVRMDQGYRPTIPAPNNYNFLQPRGR